jgi:hypothetical protein
MKHLLRTSLTLFFMIAILFVSPFSVFASEGDGGHPMEMEVNGYHVTLASQNDWTKGENTIVVTITDGIGMTVNDADVEILIVQREDGHIEPEAAEHDSESQDSMSGMDMGEPAQEATEMPAHDEKMEDPIAMMESEHGLYMVETHIEASGEHNVHVMFTANGEILQADFIIEVPGTGSKTIVLWSFVVINIALITSAGFLKKQPLTVKGTK